MPSYFQVNEPPHHGPLPFSDYFRLILRFVFNMEFHCTLCWCSTLLVHLVADSACSWFTMGFCRRFCSLWTQLFYSLKICFSGCSLCWSSKHPLQCFGADCDELELSSYATEMGSGHVNEWGFRGQAGFVTCQNFLSGMGFLFRLRNDAKRRMVSLQW